MKKNLMTASPNNLIALMAMVLSLVAIGTVFYALSQAGKCTLTETAGTYVCSKPDGTPIIITLPGN